MFFYIILISNIILNNISTSTSPYYINIDDKTYIKIEKKLKKHRLQILNLNDSEILILQNLYNKLNTIQKKEESLKISSEASTYLYKENKLRKQLIKYLKLEKFSVFYYQESKYNPMKKIPELDGIEYDKKFKYQLLSQYEKFINNTDINIRKESQIYRTQQYKLYIEQIKLFKQLPENLQVLLYEHFHIKKLPNPLKQEIIHKIMDANSQQTFII